jgi:flagellar hook-basal body complex protein FliE
MSVSGIQSTLSPQSVSQPSISIGANSGESFSKYLESALDQVNQTSEEADNLAASYAAGGPVTLDQLMIAEQQASLSLDLVVQVRNRVVSAYQSIMNMQV